MKHHFTAQLCPYSSSPDPITAIWIHQHVCVAESLDWYNDDMPSRKGMVNAIIKEMKPGHWDVLRSASATINFSGFPHSAAMQWRTHQACGTLTQSLRYTGKRFKTDAPYMSIEDLSKLFYVRDADDVQPYRQGMTNYADSLKRGMTMEQARDFLPSGYIQGWSTSGTLQAWFHLLDRRLLGDTQKESRIAAEMAMAQLKMWCPELIEWYEINRARRNKLSP